MTEGWKIFIASASFGLLILIVTLGWPYVKSKIWAKHPNTYVYLLGQENSYSIKQLKEEAPIRSKITLRPLKFPKGVSSLRNPDVPLKFFKWSYPENTKLYTITVHNRGDGVDRSVKIDIDFGRNPIKETKIDCEERVSLIQGGKPTGTRAVFKIRELLPNERQNIEILIEGKKVNSINAWSEKQQNIENVFIFDLIITPDTEFVK